MREARDADCDVRCVGTWEYEAKECSITKEFPVDQRIHSYLSSLFAHGQVTVTALRYNDAQCVSYGYAICVSCDLRFMYLCIHAMGYVCEEDAVY